MMRGGGVMKNLKIIILFLSLPFIGMLTACGSGEITVNDIKDDKSLKAFVLAAKDHLEKNYEQAIVDFRKDGGRWLNEKVYLIIIDDTSEVHLHSRTPIMEGQRNLGFEDLDTRELILPKLFAAGFDRGGDFVRYRVKNSDHPRIAYITPFMRHTDERRYILVGSSVQY